MQSSSRKRLRQSTLTTVSVGIRLLLVLSLVLAYLVTPMTMVPESLPIAAAQTTAAVQISKPDVSCVAGLELSAPITLDGVANEAGYEELVESVYGTSVTVTNTVTADEDQTSLDDSANQIQSDILGNAVRVNNKSSNSTASRQGRGDIETAAVHADYNYLYVTVGGPGALGSNPTTEPLDIINLYVALDLEPGGVFDLTTLPANDQANVTFSAAANMQPDVILFIDNTSTITMYYGPGLSSVLPVTRTANALMSSIPMNGLGPQYDYSSDDSDTSDVKMTFEVAIPWETFRVTPWTIDPFNAVVGTQPIKMSAFTAGDVEGLLSLIGGTVTNAPWDLLDIAPGSNGPDFEPEFVDFGPPGATATDQVGGSDEIAEYFWFEPDPSLLDCQYDLSVTKTMDPARATAGDIVTYTVTISNSGVTSNTFAGYAVGSVDDLRIADTLLTDLGTTLLDPTLITATSTLQFANVPQPTMSGTQATYAISSLLSFGGSGTLVFTGRVPSDIMTGTLTQQERYARRED